MSTKRKCPICEIGILQAVDDILSDMSGYVFVEKGERCSNCGEEILSEEESQRMIRIARRLNIWGQPLKLHRKLSKSGRGTTLRIPSDLEKNMGLKGDEKIEISKIGPNKILIEIMDEQ